MDRDATLDRVKQLRDEIEFLVREIQEYESRTFHSIQDQTVHAARMQRLDEIKRELDEIKAGRFPHGPNRDA